MWDLVLVLFNSHKDVVSGKILAFGSILGFPGITWEQKWTKTFNFGYVPFLLKHLILKGCLSTVFFLWDTTSGRNISKGMPYLGEKGLRNPQRVISWMLHCYENIWTFITWQPQTLN